MAIKSIASKLALSVIPIIAAFTLFFVILTYYITSSQMDKTIDDKMHESLEINDKNIQMQLAENASVAKAMALYAGTCADLLASDVNEFLSEDAARINFVGQIILSNPNSMGGGIWYNKNTVNNQEFYSHYAYIEDGTIHNVTDYSDGGNNDFHSAEWYVQLSGKDDVHWSNVYYDPVAKCLMITSTYSFFDGDGNWLGVTTADMSLVAIQNITASLTVGDTGTAFLLGDSGEYIYFSVAERDISQKMQDDDNETFSYVGSSIMEKAAGSLKFKYQGVSKRVYYKSIGTVGWKLAIAIDESEIMSSRIASFAALAVVPIIEMAVVTVSILFMAARLKRVTNKVNTFAKQAALGDFSKRINVTESDEFGVMEQQLNTMISNMSDMSERTTALLIEAQAASKSKSEFLSRMSHEIRTPMNAIAGMTQIAQESNDISKINDCLSKISVASKHLLLLINDILDMSKIEANKLELVQEEFSMEKLISNILSVNSVKIEEKNQTLKAKIDGTLPASLIGDSLRITQVITNIFSNAIKFTDKDGLIELEVKQLSNDGANCSIEITVEDSGIGMNEEQLNRLFSAFEQADGSTSRKYGGTGLGLAISKKIVGLMGGDIWAESEPGKGSIFHILLNLKIGSELPKTDDLPESDLDYDFSKFSVLIAEDIDINREIVAAILESTRIKTDFAENGVAACEMFEPGKYDLILMDLQMPEMDGLTATVNIRAKDKDVPIIAMTANAFKEDIDKCIEAGMNAHVSKPIDFDTLLRTVYKFLPKDIAADSGHSE